MINPTFRLLDESFGLQTLYTPIVPEALMRRHVRPPIGTKEFRRRSWHGSASLKAHLLEMFDYGKEIIKVVQQPLPFVIVRRLAKSHRTTLDVSPLDQQQILPRHFETPRQLVVQGAARPSFTPYIIPSHWRRKRLAVFRRSQAADPNHSAATFWPWPLGLILLLSSAVGNSTKPVPVGKQHLSRLQSRCWDIPVPHVPCSQHRIHDRVQIGSNPIAAALSDNSHPGWKIRHRRSWHAKSGHHLVDGCDLRRIIIQIGPHRIPIKRKMQRLVFCYGTKD